MTLTTAPNMTIFYGKALSSNAIGLRWKEADPPHGILKPYEVKCYNMDGAVSRSANALTNTSTSALILVLQPFHKYTCMLIASSIPYKEQNSKDCMTIIETTSFRTYRMGK